MYSVNLYNETNKLLSEFEIEKINEFDSSSFVNYVPSMKYEHIKFLNQFVNTGITVLIPNSNMDDFIIQYRNNTVMNYYPYETQHSLEGALIIKTIFKNDKKKIMLNLFREVYKTDSSRFINLNLFENHQMIKSFRIKIIRYCDKIFYLIRDITTMTFLKRREKILFENYFNNTIIIQNKKIIQANKTFLKTFNIKNLSFDTYKKFFSEIKVIEGPSLQELREIYLEILGQELFHYYEKVHILFSGDDYWFNVYITFTTYNDKPAVLVVFNDISDQQKTTIALKEKSKEALTLQKELYKIQSFSRTGMSYQKGNSPLISTPVVFDALGIDPKDFNNYSGNFLEYVLEEDQKILIDSHKKCTPTNPENIFMIRVNTKMGIRHVNVYLIYDFDEEGNYIGRVDFYQDVTELIESENNLKTALNEKDTLLKEVHHRVKNNLQIISSLINLGEYYKSDNPENLIEDIKNRINAMALVHEKIYASDTLDKINMKEYIKSIVTSLFNLYNADITFIPDLDPVEIELSEAIPLGLILNELITNVIKYAFPNNQSGDLYISLKEDNDIIKLIFKDNGVGFPDDLNVEDLSTLGMVVVKNLTYQIDGTIELHNDNGAYIEIVFNRNQ